MTSSRDSLESKKEETNPEKYNRITRELVELACVIGGEQNQFANLTGKQLQEKAAQLYAEGQAIILDSSEPRHVLKERYDLFLSYFSAYERFSSAMKNTDLLLAERRYLLPIDSETPNKVFSKIKLFVDVRVSRESPKEEEPPKKSPRLFDQAEQKSLPESPKLKELKELQAGIESFKELLSNTLETELVEKISSLDDIKKLGRERLQKQAEVLVASDNWRPGAPGGAPF